MTTTALPRPAALALTVRKALDTPPTDSRRLVRAVRSALVRQSFAFGGTVLLLCMAHVWVQHRVDEVGKQLWEAHKLVERLQQQRNELTLERETFRDHSRLSDYARDKLGLVPPRKGQMIEVR